jgi:TPR repeat protein
MRAKYRDFQLASIAPEDAIELLEPAANNGNPRAALMLMRIYLTGCGVPRDY